MSNEHTEFWAAVGRREADQWECLSINHNWPEPLPATWYLNDIYLYPQDWTLRRKPLTIVVNGVECVAGYVGEIAYGTEYAYPDPTEPDGYYLSNWTNHIADAHRQRYVGVYLGPDKEAQAGAVGKAMRLSTETKS